MTHASQGTHPPILLCRLQVAEREADWTLDAAAVAAEETATADGPARSDTRDATLACPAQMLKGRCE